MKPEAPPTGALAPDWSDSITGDQSAYAIAAYSGVTLGAHVAEVSAKDVLTRHRSLQAFGMSRFAS